MALRVQVHRLDQYLSRHVQPMLNGPKSCVCRHVAVVLADLVDVKVPFRRSRGRMPTTSARSAPVFGVLFTKRLVIQAKTFATTALTSRHEHGSLDVYDQD